MRILLVEDDIKIAQFVTKGLEQAGFAVDRADNGIDGLHLALSEPYDVAIVDVMLPGIDGLALVKKVRGAQKRLPIIILSAKRSIEDRVYGLQVGSDDYLAKPFAFSELLARVQALIRRASGAPESMVIKVSDLSLDLVKREVVRAGIKIFLQPREFSLLEYLMRNAGRVVSKTMIMEHVWDYNFDPMSNVVEVRINRLRSKIDQDFEKKLIHTVRGVGYALKEAD